jgi:hypothetical protein
VGAIVSTFVTSIVGNRVGFGLAIMEMGLGAGVGAIIGALTRLYPSLLQGIIFEFAGSNIPLIPPQAYEGFAQS